MARVGGLVVGWLGLWVAGLIEIKADSVQFQTFCIYIHIQVYETFLYVLRLKMSIYKSAKLFCMYIEVYQTFLEVYRSLSNFSGCI